MQLTTKQLRFLKAAISKNSAREVLRHYNCLIWDERKYLVSCDGKMIRGVPVDASLPVGYYDVSKIGEMTQIEVDKTPLDMLSVIESAMTNSIPAGFSQFDEDARLAIFRFYPNGSIRIEKKQWESSVALGEYDRLLTNSAGTTLLSLWADGSFSITAHAFRK